MAAHCTQILLLGASGYIGGSVLDRLLSHSKLSSTDLKITVLLRAKDKADVLASAQLGVGLRPVVGDAADLELLEKLASEVDLVVDAFPNTVPTSAAILRGLKRRFDATGKKPALIHTSGAGLLRDDANGNRGSDVIWYDNDPEQIETLDPRAPHRPVDLEVLKASQEGYVDTYIIVPGVIYGLASGRLVDLGIQRRVTIPTPILVKEGISRGSVIHPGKGKNIWPFVHIDDCADLYLTLISNLLDGKNVPSGREGFYFAESSEHTTYEFAKIIGETLKDHGKLLTDEPTGPTDNESEATLFLLSFFSGNSRCRGVRSRSVGWKPKHGAADLVGFVKEDIAEIVKDL